MSEPFLGEIKMVGFNFAPRGWSFCDGQLLPIAQNSALFSLLGTTYGGDGRTTFGLPDLRSRSPVHPGRGAGLGDIRQGARGGAETETLTTNNLPSHTHTLRAVDDDGTLAGASGNALANSAADYSSADADTNMHATSITSTGGNRSFNIRSPYLGIYFCIALAGTFPSRN